MKTPAVFHHTYTQLLLISVLAVVTESVWQAIVLIGVPFLGALAVSFVSYVRGGDA